MKMTKQNKRLLVILIVVVVLLAAALTAVFLLTAPERNRDTVVAQIGGEDITLRQLEPYIEMSYDNLNSYLGQEFSLDTQIETGTSVADYVLYDALTVLRTYKLIEQKAAQYDVELSPAQQTELSAAISNYEGKYPDVFAYSARCDLLYNALFDYFYSRKGTELPSDGEVLAWCEENGVIRADYILLYYEDARGNRLTRGEMAAQRELGNQILFLYATGADFDDLEEQYSYDGLVTDTYMSAAECHQEFLNAYYALADGKISDLVEFEYGYFIIRRLAIDPDDILAAGHMTGQLFNEKVTLWLSQQDYRTTENYLRVDRKVMEHILDI